MSSDKKRKAPSSTEAPASIAVKVRSGEDARTPYIATFPGVTAPQNLTFDAYKRKKPKKSSEAKDVVLHGSTDRIEFDAQNFGHGEEGLCDYYVGIYDKSTNKVEIVPAPHVHVTRTVKALKNISRDDKGRQQYREARNALGEAFGTKKAKQAIKSQDANKVEASTLDNVADAIVSDVKAATKNMPTKEDMKREQEEDRPIPTPNVESETPAGVYPLDTVISPAELSIINVKPFLAPDLATDKKKREGLLPYRQSTYVTDRLTKILSSNAEKKDTHRLKLLYYASLLMAFYVNHRVAGKKDILSTKLGSPPQILVDGFISRYTEQPGGDARPVVTAKRLDKVLCYLFVVCLHLDNFSVDMNMLAADLSLKAARTQELFRTLGCKVMGCTETQRVALNISKAEARNYKRAVLKCPPEFPEVRKRIMAKR
ncbi:Rpa49 subunit specific to nuclear RNA polymerase I [Saitoella complicata NRRL Y-17804]|uniref:DNA-directed RNA polymerase I subunit RPA49 n=1 Tax=Saitoella complicata (strain BCRC 22490 / CBS 7301 / JCM 7358 / NBRC 10748 / NRRL Y-17804) TaxID=698492 RepID=A0A0E9NJN0_SAICN|nr:Rpa49 subunit specific to nuclear RNA polymerase I [Saitoella complicata NRRL Y-17804]ODQ54544.1 Rpa49 subunit specific to nuclear RNA polymerase I [Saitoella complicata NRRL Y-17804]GAO50087.1 hypothetical protein G7K_4222-t1 [Saitoella complicata NRRL Y-17804]